MWRRGYRKNSQEIMLIFANKLDDRRGLPITSSFQRKELETRSEVGHGLHH
jgi:hypothetical protein